MSGFFLAVTSAGLLVLAALAATKVWVPFNAWRWLATAAAVLSLSLMSLFFDVRKVIPIAFDLVVLWAAWDSGRHPPFPPRSDSSMYGVHDSVAPVLRAHSLPGQ